jgi:hypothetical protein
VVGLAGAPSALCRSPRDATQGRHQVSHVSTAASSPTATAISAIAAHTQIETALFVIDASSLVRARTPRRFCVTATADLRAHLLSLPRFPLTASRMQLGSSSSIEPTLAGAAEVEDSDVPYATAVENPPGVLPQQWNEWIHSIRDEHLVEDVVCVLCVSVCLRGHCLGQRAGPFSVL